MRKDGEKAADGAAEQTRGGMKEGRPPHPRLRTPPTPSPLFGQHLMKVGNHGNRHVHKSQLKKQKMGKKPAVLEQKAPQLSDQVICIRNEKSKNVLKIISFKNKH